MIETIAPKLLATNGVNVYSANLDGTAVTYLTSDPAGYGNDHAAWSSDGRRIVYAHREPGQTISDAWLMNADGSGKVRITTGGGDLPTLSPEGSTITYVGPVTDGTRHWTELWQVNANGSNPHRLTTTTVDGANRQGEVIRWSTNPSYSPDGSQLVYASTQSGRSQLWLMNADGTNQRQLTFPTDPGAPDANAPMWSPDGTKIAYFGGYETEYGNIYTIRPDGTDRTELTHLPAGESADNPVWFPDSVHLLFQSNWGPGDLAGPTNTFVTDTSGSSMGLAAAGANLYSKELFTRGDRTVTGAPGDVLRGDAGRSLLDGSAGGQTLLGSDGQTLMLGGPGDVIVGGAGTDAISGAPGDAIIGGYGWDWIDGSAGGQAITGGPGYTTIIGGAGDVIYGSTAAGSCLIIGAPGDAIMGGGHDTIDGSAGGQVITGGGNAIWAGPGDTIYGGHGDTVTGFDQAAGERLVVQGPIDAVLATAYLSGNDTVLTTPAGTVTLVGVSHVDASFFL